MKFDEIEIAFRTLTIREERKQLMQSERHIELERWPNTTLIIDTETTTDAAQALKFGTGCIYRWDEKERLVLRREYLFYADDLKQTDPEGYDVLIAYVRNHKNDRLRFVSRSEFLKDVLWPACKARTLIAGFNLPFDLSRLAVAWRETRGKRFRGGFSLNPMGVGRQEHGAAWRREV